MKIYEDESVKTNPLCGVGCIPTGTFHGADLVPPGTFH
jgi:hypothetical protein